MKKTTLCWLLFFCLRPSVKAQSALNRYVDSALQNNIVLQQRNIDLQKAEYALKISKEMFYPTVELQTQYLSASGGRDIFLPIGDMLNGVYTTLNQLTKSQRFPQLDNEHINFLPENFYDAKVHTTVPIFNSKTIYNKRIKEQQVTLSNESLQIYKRELIESVKTAYYTYLQSLDVITIYESALQLAEEGKRVNEKLLEYGKGLPAYVLRANSEIESVKAKLSEAQQNSDNAKRSFNFLLNREQETAIDTSGKSIEIPDDILKALNTIPDIKNREELQAMNTSIALQKNVWKMNKAVRYPSLNGFLDLGSQAENWVFDNQSRYYMVGLQLNVPVFTGFQNRDKIKLSALDVAAAKLQQEQVSAQLQLSSHVAQNDLRSAYQNYLSAKKQLTAAQSYERLIKRGYEAGVNSYIETVDARNQLTDAELAVSGSRFKMLSAAASFERETASYNLN